MKAIKVLPDQTLMDIAVQHMGSADAANTIARLNNIPLTETLIPGQLINIPDSPDDRRTARIMEEGGWEPAAGDYEKQEGIGHWYIGVDFIVS